jgi:hypothetical protein
MTEKPYEEQEVPEAPVIIEEDEFVVPEKLGKGKKDNNRTLWIILIIIAALILLCCCAAVILFIVGFDWILDQLRNMWSSLSPLLAMMA